MKTVSGAPVGRWGLAVLASLMLAGAQAAERLHVKEGQTYVLPETQADIVFDEMILDDNASLVLPSGVEQWRIEARRARIGSGVRIVGVGADGAKGADGLSPGGRAKPCRPGKDGGQGGAGGAGGAGAALSMALGIAHLGDLSIDVAGGNGGVGGAGGAGQDGGPADNCAGGKGGDGGNGGDGGDGGNGGNVRLSYRFLSATGDTGIGKRVAVNGNPGQPGAPGAGGSGGKGDKGHFIIRQTLSGNTQWVPGGKVGSAGEAGKPGRMGVKGQGVIERDLSQRIDEVLRQRAPASAPVAPTPADDSELRELKQMLKQMQQRIETLEKSD